MNVNKSMLFLIIGLGCFWLVLDNFYGEKYINNLVSNILN